MRRIAVMPRLSPGALLRPPAPAAFPLDQSCASVWYNARVAIWQGVKALGFKRGDRVLVPAYACGSEIDALLTAGLDVDFYRVASDLSPDLDHVASLAREGARGLCVIHYFGFPQRMDDIVAVARRHGLLVIEDNAHGLYSADAQGRPLGSFGDMAVFSFAKTLPLPDGGGLVLAPRAAAGNGTLKARRPDVLRVAGKLKYLAEEAVASRYPGGMATFTQKVGRIVSAKIKALVYDAREPRGDDDSEEALRRTMALDPDRTHWSMSAVARRLLAGAPHRAIRDSRIRNFEAFAGRFHGDAHVSALFPTLPAGTCPLFFPVRVSDAAALYRFLRDHGVNSMRFWTVFHEVVPRERFPFESALKLSVLALPIHQDLDEDDMSYLAALVNRWQKECA